MLNKYRVTSGKCLQTLPFSFMSVAPSSARTFIQGLPEMSLPLDVTSAMELEMEIPH